MVNFLWESLLWDDLLWGNGMSRDVENGKVTGKEKDILRLWDHVPAVL